MKLSTIGLIGGLGKGISESAKTYGDYFSAKGLQEQRELMEREKEKRLDERQIASEGRGVAAAAALRGTLKAEETAFRLQQASELEAGAAKISGARGLIEQGKYGPANAGAIAAGNVTDEDRIQAGIARGDFTQAQQYQMTRDKKSDASAATALEDSKLRDTRDFDLRVKQLNATTVANTLQADVARLALKTAKEKDEFEKEIKVRTSEYLKQKHFFDLDKGNNPMLGEELTKRRNWLMVNSPATLSLFEGSSTSTTSTNEFGEGETKLVSKGGIMSNDTSSARASGKTQAPTVGDVVGGYRFKGGNPNVQANWERI